QLGDEEQNPISPDRPWRVLGDRTRSECTRWEIGEERQLFEGVHRGYAHRPSGALCHRQVRADLETGRWAVVDRVEGRGTERVRWRLHLAGEEVVPVAASGGTREFLLPGSPPVRIRLELPGTLEVSVRASEISDRYGVRASRPCLVAEGEVSLPCSIAVAFEVEGRAAAER